MLCPEAAAQARVATLSAAERELLGRAVAVGPVFWAGGIETLGRMGPIPVFAEGEAGAELELGP